MIYIPISIGELYDRITILEIKVEKLSDKGVLASLRDEISLLMDITLTLDKKPSQPLKNTLKEVNLLLWNIEDAIREKEMMLDFGDEFVELARLVYKMNDERSRIKAKINEECGSELTEIKSYKKYD